MVDSITQKVTESRIIILTPALSVRPINLKPTMAPKFNRNYWKLILTTEKILGCMESILQQVIPGNTLSAKDSTTEEVSMKQKLVRTQGTKTKIFLCHSLGV